MVTNVTLCPNQGFQLDVGVQLTLIKKHEVYFLVWIDCFPNFPTLTVFEHANDLASKQTF